MSDPQDWTQPPTAPISVARFEEADWSDERRRADTWLEAGWVGVSDDVLAREEAGMMLELRAAQLDEADARQAERAASEASYEARCRKMAAAARVDELARAQHQLRTLLMLGGSP